MKTVSFKAAGRNLQLINVNLLIMCVSSFPYNTFSLLSNKKNPISINKNVLNTF